MKRRLFIQHSTTLSVMALSGLAHGAKPPNITRAHGSDDGCLDYLVEAVYKNNGTVSLLDGETGECTTAAAVNNVDAIRDDLGETMQQRANSKATSGFVREQETWECYHSDVTDTAVNYTLQGNAYVASEPCSAEPQCANGANGIRRKIKYPQGASVKVKWIPNGTKC